MGNHQNHVMPLYIAGQLPFVSKLCGVGAYIIRSGFGVMSCYTEYVNSHIHTRYSLNSLEGVKKAIPLGSILGINIKGILAV